MEQEITPHKPNITWRYNTDLYVKLNENELEFRWILVKDVLHLV